MKAKFLGVFTLIFRVVGIQYLVFIIVCLFIGVQVMFEYRRVFFVLTFGDCVFTAIYREEELRNGISRRC
jgi:hypothetical protein